MSAGDFSVNPSYFLDAYRLTNPWVVWAICRGGMVDLDKRAVTEDDVLDKETLRLLPRRVRLKEKP